MSILRRILGGAAAVGLGAMGLWASGGGPAVSGPGQVVALRELRVEHAGDGLLRWRELDGTPPGGPTVVAERVFTTGRGELLGFSLADGLAAGARVEAGAPLLRLSLPAADASVAAAQAEAGAARAAVEALKAGGRVGDRVAARAAWEVAKAAARAAEEQLAQAEGLAARGAAPTWEAALARQAVGVARAEEAAARAQVQAAENLPLDEEIRAAEAMLGAAEARAAEAQARALAAPAAAPWSGVLGQPGGDTLLVLRGDGGVAVQVALPESAREEVRAGDAARFRPRSGGAPVSGMVIAVADEAAVMGTRVVTWATVRLDAPAPVGSTGHVEILDGGGR